MKKLLLVSLCLLFATGVALGHWDEGDPNKMHFPQLPDPYGWDIAFDDYEGLQRPLGDDWLCTETGPVKDIHIWVSWLGDEACQVTSLDVSIYSNNPSGPGGYSQPNESLWQRTLSLANGDYTVRDYGTGDQGWYDPFEVEAISNDHNDFQQINITNIENAFNQAEGEIYWLVVSAVWNVEPVHWLGWKTADVNEYPAPYTGEHFMDDAVWWDGANWQELRDPYTNESLDLAFVITPEPATIALLGLGVLLLRRRKSA